MRVTFLGAAREVTGSCHAVDANGYRVLLDCGLFQGRRRESDAKNRRLPCAVDSITSIVLSHAHMDHAGRLPLLVKHGYAGPIHATAATKDLIAIMLADSAHIQEKDATFLRRHGRDAADPLYSLEDVIETIALVDVHAYDTWFDVAPGVRASFSDAGHILGSASVTVEATEHDVTSRLIYSGDIGRPGLPIIRDPDPPAFDAGIVIMESTYGGRRHESVDDTRSILGDIVRATAARGGRIFIPAFAVGRAQEIIYDLHILSREGAIPSIPIYVDSPLAAAATRVFSRHHDMRDTTEPLVASAESLFAFGRLNFTKDVAASKRLNAEHGPMIIIAGSGMVEAGRILHHLRNGAADPRNTIVIVGFQAEHTLGRRIVERQAVIRIMGEEVPLRAQVVVISGYSAHADQDELVAWASAVVAACDEKPTIFLVHGETPAQASLSSLLAARGLLVESPAVGETTPEIRRAVPATAASE